MTVYPTKRTHKFMDKKAHTFKSPEKRPKGDRVDQRKPASVPDRDETNARYSRPLHRRRRGVVWDLAGRHHRTLRRAGWPAVGKGEPDEPRGGLWHPGTMP